MVVLVESGSTKADWAVLEEGGAPVILQSEGMNPMLHSLDYMQQQIKNAMAPIPGSRHASAIFFYGAGCWEEEQKGQVKEALRHYFCSQTRIEVEHDLLGAARAACGREAGIACILGTGSNSCHYDGQRVVDTVTNLGFMLGDEGSGADLGKRLIRAYFYRELPPVLESLVAPLFPNGKADIAHHVYVQPGPNRYLASFAPFLNEHLDQPILKQIVKDSFAEFLDRHVMKYEQDQPLPVHFIGSVAHFFQPVLLELLGERNLRPGRFIRRPIHQLIPFHRAS